MTCEINWYKNGRMYTVVDKDNRVVLITSDFRNVKQLLGFLDTSKIPDTVYM